MEQCWHSGEGQNCSGSDNGKMELKQTQTQPWNTSPAVGSPWLWATTEAKMRNDSLSGLDLLDDLPWSVMPLGIMCGLVILRRSGVI